MTKKEKKARAANRNAARTAEHDAEKRKAAEKNAENALYHIISAYNAETYETEQDYAKSCSYEENGIVFRFLGLYSAHGERIGYQFGDDISKINVSSPAYNKWYASLSDVPYMGWGGD